MFGGKKPAWIVPLSMLPSSYHYNDNVYISDVNVFWLLETQHMTRNKLEKKVNTNIYWERERESKKKNSRHWKHEMKLKIIDKPGLKVKVVVVVVAILPEKKS